MQLNPLVVMLWLLILGWLWGAIGVLLAVPLLVCIKLTLAQLNIWPDWLKIIETQG
jgi:predicted PurR-regulated permease PerM